MIRSTFLVLTIFLITFCLPQSKENRKLNEKSIFITESSIVGDSGLIGESNYFRFYNLYWLNMHHFLYNKAIMFENSNLEEVISSKNWNVLNQKEQVVFKEVLSFYSKNIIIEDLRRGEYNNKFKQWVVLQTQRDSLLKEASFSKHVGYLNNFKEIYSKLYWALHEESNNSVFNQNFELIQKYEDEFVEELVRLCKTKWQTKPIRVDISYNSKRDIPYTTIYPTTHIVMDSKNTPLKKGVWFELLFHESSHHLISTNSGFVGGTINNTAEVLNTKIPNQMWHSFLFYFSGKLAKDFLSREGADQYSIYMEKNRFFGPMYPVLEKYMPSYIENKETLSEVTSKIITELNN